MPAARQQESKVPDRANVKADVTSPCASVLVLGRILMFFAVGVQGFGDQTAFLLGASLRFALELDPASHLRPLDHAAAISICSPVFLYTGLVVSSTCQG